MGIVVILLRQIESLGGHIGVRLRALTNGLHFCLQHQAHQQRQPQSDAQCQRQHLDQRLADRMSLGGPLKEVGAGGQIILIAASIVVIGKVVQKGVLQQRSGIFAHHAVGITVPDVQAVISAPCALQEQDAVPAFSDTKVVFIIDIGRRVVGVVAVVLVVFHGDDIHGASIPP